MVELDIRWGFLGAIDNARHLTAAAKAAARTRSLHRTGSGNYFHLLLLKNAPLF